MAINLTIASRAGQKLARITGTKIKTQTPLMIQIKPLPGTERRDVTITYFGEDPLVVSGTVDGNLYLRGDFFQRDSSVTATGNLEFSCD